MDSEATQRRSVFYPFTMVTACSFVGAVVVGMGLLQLFALPQGSGFPLDNTFWHPVIPYAVIAGMGLGLSFVFSRVSTVRDMFLSAAIMSGAWTIGFGLMLFTTAERQSIDDLVQARPAAPDNNYFCTRKADGGMECLNELGQPDPNYSYTVIERKKSDL